MIESDNIRIYNKIMENNRMTKEIEILKWLLDVKFECTDKQIREFRKRFI